MTNETKIKLLCNEDYDFLMAKEILTKRAQDIFKQDIKEQAIDLTGFYFYGDSDTHRDFYRIQNNDVIAGTLVGMIGDILIIRQKRTGNQVYFALSVKKYISYVVKIYYDKELASYSYEPKQMKLW